MHRLFYLPLLPNLQPLNHAVMKAKVLLLFSVIPIPIVLGAQNESWFQKGREATEPKEMIEYYTKSIEQEGVSVCTFYYRGMAKYDLKDYKGAADDFTIAIKTDSKYRDGVKIRAELKDNLKAQNDAYSNDRMDSMNTENCRKLSYYSHGNANYNLQDYMAAIDDYSKFILIDPNNQEYYNSRSYAYNSRSASYYFLKRYDLAIADISKYISLKPDDPNGYNNRGLCYLTLAKYDDAIAEFNKTIRLKPDYASAYADRGYAYMQQGKWETAIDDFNKCLKIDEETFSTNLDLAIIYYLKGNLQESKKYLGIAKSLEPRLSKGIDVIAEFEKEGYYWTDKDKETLKKMFVELK